MPAKYKHLCQVKSSWLAIQQIKQVLSVKHNIFLGNGLAYFAGNSVTSKKVLKHWLMKTQFWNFLALDKLSKYYQRPLIFAEENNLAY